jgi:hypothetical protein
MPSIQQNLTEIGVQGVGHIPAATTQVAADNSAATILGGLASVVPAVIAANEKAGETAAVKDTTDAILKLQAQREQDPQNFTQTMMNTKLNELNVSMIKTHEGNSELVNDTFNRLTGRVPFKEKIATDFVKFNAEYEEGVPFADEGASKEEIAAKGAQIIAHKKRLALSVQEAQAATASMQVQKGMTASALAKQKANQLDKGMAVYEGMTKLGTEAMGAVLSGAENLGDAGDVALFQAVNVPMNDMIRRGRATLINATAGFQPDVIKTVMDAYELSATATLKLFDTAEGIVPVQNAKTLIAHYQAQRGLRFEMVAPAVLRMKELLGERGIGDIAAQLLAGNKTLTEPLLSQLEKTLLDRGISQENITEAFSIRERLVGNSTPLFSQEFLASPSVRSQAGAETKRAAQNYAKGMGESGQAGKDNEDQWSRTSAFLLTIGHKMSEAKNVGNIVAEIGSSGWQAALKHHSKDHPDKARFLQGAATDLAYRSLTETVRNLQDQPTAASPWVTGYNPDDGLFHVIYEGADAKHTVTEGSGETLGRKTPTLEQMQVLDRGNTALNAAVAMKPLDPVFKNMSDKAYRDLLVRSIIPLTGKNPLVGGGSWDKGTDNLSDAHREASTQFGKAEEQRRHAAMKSNLYPSKLGEADQAIVNQSVAAVGKGLEGIKKIGNKIRTERWQRVKGKLVKAQRIEDQRE